MSSIVLAIGLLILAVYLGVVIKEEKECPPSISDTFYECGKWWFTIVMFVEAVLLSMALINASGPNIQFLAFFSGAALGFVGAAPHFKEAYEKKIHFGGAYTFGLCSQAWVALAVSPWILLTWIPGAAAIMLWKSKGTFIAEIMCIINIAIAIYSL